MFSLILFMFTIHTMMEIDALETTAVKDVRPQFKAALPHGCMALKERPSPMPGNFTSTPASKSLGNFAICIKSSSTVVT